MWHSAKGGTNLHGGPMCYSLHMMWQYAGLGCIYMGQRVCPPYLRCRKVPGPDGGKNGAIRPNTQVAPWQTADAGAHAERECASASGFLTLTRSCMSLVLLVLAWLLDWLVLWVHPSQPFGCVLDWEKCPGSRAFHYNVKFKTLPHVIHSHITSTSHNTI
jgi:hypothetical protein